MSMNPDNPAAGETTSSDAESEGTTQRYMRFLGETDGPPAERPGDEIGPYRLVSLLGSGSFGTVWVAERREPFRQAVALKLIKLGMDSRAVVARFEQERQALALLNHPSIAKVIDGGLTRTGRPYFAMEYVKGEPINEFCDRRKLTLEARLALFAQACDAIHHAHLKGIVHRDIKPAHVLAFEQDGKEPALKVIDFGVAKALTQRLSEQTIFTETGQMIGTPEYMSPEQADPTAADIDARSDVYSLGVLLYELITGELPFDPRELRRKAYGEIQRTLREVDPPAPSTRLSTVSILSTDRAKDFARTRGLQVSEAIRRLRRELEWIPLKAMRKEPAGRYQSAALLGDDVRNYLSGKALVAAPESVVYRLRKFVRRNPVRAAMITVIPLAVVLGLGAMILPAFRAYEAMQRARAMQVFVTLEDEPDPRVVTDPSARARISATGLPWRIRHQVTGIELLLVPPGEFSLGSPEGEVGRKAQWEIQRKCSITQPFYLAATEVSQRQWLQIMPTNPSWFDEFQVAGLADQLELPVDQVTWVECNDFCDEAGGVFRLPSEAEWEYACRAGTTTAFSFGDSITIGQVNFDSQKPFAGGAPAQGRGTTVRCGSLPGNQWGFHEMHGNVMEWCADAWQDQPDRTTEAPTTHPNPKQARPCRGGGWYSAGAFCRSATRNMNSPRGADSICGFRVAMSVR